MGRMLWVTGHGDASMEIEVVMDATGAEVGVAGQAVVVSAVGAEGTALFLEAAGLVPGAVVSGAGVVGPPTQLAVELPQYLSGPDGWLPARSHQAAFGMRYSSLDS